MRIAVWHDPPAGGARRAIEELVARLGQRHEIDYYRIRDTAGPFAGGADQIGRARGIRVEEIRFNRRPHRRLGLYWNDWLTALDQRDMERLERDLAERIDARGYDAALVSVLRSGQAPSVLAYLHTPAAYFCHEVPRRFSEPWCRPEAAPLSPWERMRLYWRRPSLNLLDGQIRRRDMRNVRCARLVLTNSCHTRERIRAVYGRSAEVSYLGVDADAFQPPINPPGPTRVLSVGALEPHKGFDFVIGALGRVPASRRPALDVVGASGHPRMPAYLAQLARKAGVSLEIHTAVPDDELRRLYARAAVFVFGARHEPFGLVILEAMASGLPIVAVAEGGVPEIVKEGEIGHLVARDEVAFAAALEGLLIDRECRQRMGARARVRAERDWRWEVAAGRLDQHLSDIAQAGTRRAPGQT